MNINKAYKIEEVMHAVRDYLKMNNRRVTFEYMMLDGINDTKESIESAATNSDAESLINFEYFKCSIFSTE